MNDLNKIKQDLRRRITNSILITNSKAEDLLFVISTSEDSSVLELIYDYLQYGKKFILHYLSNISKDNSFYGTPTELLSGMKKEYSAGFNIVEHEGDEENPEDILNQLD